MSDKEMMGQELFDFLGELHLQEFFVPIRDKLQVTKISQLETIKTEALEEIGLSRLAIQRLLQAVKAWKPFSSLNNVRHLLQNVSSRLSSASKSDLNIKNIFSSSSIITKPSQPADYSHVIPSSDLFLCMKLGCEGRFGIVKSAIWRRHDKLFCKVVAVKILNDQHASKESFSDFGKLASFISEAGLLNKLDHPHLLKLHGISYNTKTMLISELASLGSLPQYLRKNKMPLTRLFSYASQLADALTYLEAEGCVHRDIRLKNVFLANEDNVKLGDMALSHILPIKNCYFAWAAPETLRNNEVSHASDTWMYAVTLWEMFSFGEEPWIGFDEAGILRQLDKRVRLVKPARCPLQIYEMLLQCWRSQPENRPTFSAILRFLQAGVSLVEVRAKNAFFEANDSNKLKLEKGDQLLVIDGTSDKNWWYGQNKRNYLFGYFSRSEVDVPTCPKSDIGKLVPGNFVDIVGRDSSSSSSKLSTSSSAALGMKPTKLETRKSNSQVEKQLEKEEPPIFSPEHATVAAMKASTPRKLVAVSAPVLNKANDA